MSLVCSCLALSQSNYSGRAVLCPPKQGGAAHTKNTKAGQGILLPDGDPVQRQGLSIFWVDDVETETDGEEPAEPIKSPSLAGYKTFWGLWCHGCHWKRQFRHALAYFSDLFLGLQAECNFEWDWSKKVMITGTNLSVLHFLRLHGETGSCSHYSYVIVESV